MQPTPIETFYRGDRFRSRLEARWAVYFTGLGLEYVYELEGFVLSDGTRYLPDFWLPTFQCWAEVKPRTLERYEFDKCAQLATGCLLLDSPRPDCMRGYFYTGHPFEHKVTYDAYTAGEHWFRVLLPESVYKGRLWFLMGETPANYIPTERTMNAIRAAHGARFEFGETPELAGVIQ